MDEIKIVMLVLGIGVPLFFALIIGIIVFSGRARPQHDLGPRPAPTGNGTDGVWNALILADSPIGTMGGTLGSQAGRFHIQQGMLSFVPDGEDGRAWSVPCAQITARGQTAFSTAGVLLWLPTVYLRCVVSREHINRISRNSIKTMREPRYYREFVDALVSHGARQG